jgi:hypothetical protein
MSEVEIIVDGSSLGNPGLGGWACILRCGDNKRVLQGGAPETTNNRMEIDSCYRESACTESRVPGNRADGLRLRAPWPHGVSTLLERERLAQLREKAGC